MNKVIEMSNSLTSSVRKEMMLVRLDDESPCGKCYFVEYPTNLLPKTKELDNFEGAVEIPRFDYDKLRKAFHAYTQNLTSGMYFLHAPTFIYSYMLAIGVDLREYGIFVD